jgi:hypothetical protein
VLTTYKLRVPQGVGKLTVVGPSGIQSCLDLMLPIINRKYPVLDVVEVDHDTPQDKLLIRSDHWVIRAYPVYPNGVSEGINEDYVAELLQMFTVQSCRKVLAVAADIVRSAVWESSPGNSSNSPATVCTVLPVPYYFEAVPTMDEIVQLSSGALQDRLGVYKRAFLFTRVGVSSFDTAPVHTSEHWQRMERLCLEHNACGIFDMVRGRSSVSLRIYLTVVVVSGQSLRQHYRVRVQSGHVEYTASPVQAVVCGRRCGRVFRSERHADRA